jgi:hypothetical protein
MEDFSAAAVIRNHEVERALLYPVSMVSAWRDLRVDLTYGKESGNAAIVVDVTGANALGRLTWWSGGTYSSEAIRTTDDFCFFDRQGDAPTANEALEALKEVCAKVAAELPPNNSFKPNPLRGSA